MLTSLLPGSSLCAVCTSGFVLGLAGLLPWLFPALVEFGCIPHGSEVPLPSRCLESPCSTPGEQPSIPDPLGMLLSWVSSKVLRAPGALEVLEETFSSRTCRLSAPKDAGGT